MKIAILVREETMQRCTGRGCLNAFFQKKDAFKRYEGKIELVTFSHAGGDIDHKIETMIKNGVDVVHLSSCMRGKASNYETLAKRLGEHFDVVGYTHGAENGKRKDTIFSLAPRGIAEQISVIEDKDIFTGSERAGNCR